MQWPTNYKQFKLKFHNREQFQQAVRLLKDIEDYADHEDMIILIRGLEAAKATVRCIAAGLTDYEIIKEEND